MTVHLLDVNILIALTDKHHVFHSAALRWLFAHRAEGWATCPITENGLLRIVGSAGYTNVEGGPAVVAAVVADLRLRPGHRFWPDDVSLLDTDRFHHDRLRTTGHVTDSYLLGLAVAHGGKLATFDRRLATDAVRGGADALTLIDAAVS